MITSAILEDYADLGFQLREDGDHILELYFKDKRIQTFSQTGATQETLWQACQDYWDSLNGGKDERNV
jgi:hypothetical protein